MSNYATDCTTRAQAHWTLSKKSAVPYLGFNNPLLLGELLGLLLLALLPREIHTVARLFAKGTAMIEIVRVVHRVVSLLDQRLLMLMLDLQKALGADGCPTTPAVA